MKNKRVIVPIIVILAVLIVDQIVKIWVKTHMIIGEEIHIFGDRVMLKFVENPGMAFGMELGGNWGKMALSIFRILAVGGLIWYLVTLIKKKRNLFLISCISLIIAGAAGNLIDCAFYGIIFTDSYGQIAQMFPDGDGYAGFLMGRVVDMIYCPVIQTESFTFFSPIFNVADSAITVTVFMMIIGYKKLMPPKDEEKKEEEVAEDTK